jgi:diaminohydroxyphosphoribosylaminopyrimidine deaminase/5-amino-6-(5-phosphoribosylamino)uracil reductase
MVRDRRDGVGRAGGAVLVGGNTFAQDDPLLTARTPAPPRQPLAAVVMSRLPGMDAPFQLIRNRPEECVFFSSVAQAASPNAQALRRKGARVYGLDRAASGRGLDAGQMLVQLRQTEQCLYVLCEGGGRLALSLLDRGLVDEFHLHLAPLVLGDAEACPLFSGRDADSITDAIRLRLDRVEVVEGDTHLYFRPARKP